MSIRSFPAQEDVQHTCTFSLDGTNLINIPSRRATDSYNKAIINSEPFPRLRTYVNCIIILIINITIKVNVYYTLFNK